MKNSLSSSSSEVAFSRRSVLRAATYGCAIGAGLPLMTGPARAQTPLLRATAIYPSRSAANWPLWIASRAGYLAEQGVEVDLRFGLHPAGMAALVGGQAQFSVYGLEQILMAVAREPALVIPAGYLSRGSFALIARKEFKSIKDLKGKRIGIGRIGDPLFTYTVELLNRAGIASTHVTWVPSGTDSATRAPMLLNGQLDAALLVAPSYFRLLETGELHSLASLLNSDVSVSNVIVFSKKAVEAMPKLPEAIIKASAQGTKRFYEDRAFSVETFRAFDPQAKEQDVARLWDMYVGANAFNRVPTMRKTALQASIARVAVDVPSIKSVSPQQYIDNNIVSRLAQSGFFEKLYGPSVLAEQRAALADAV